MKLLLPSLILLAAASTLAGPADLHLASEDNTYQLRANGSLLLEGLYIDGNEPGLLFTDDDFFFHPRLTLNLDAFAWDWLSGRVRLRADRGLDPGTEEDGDLRLDEYYLRADYGDHRIRVGKFASLFGAWIRRSQAGENAFLNSPPAYENITIAVDQKAFPGSKKWIYLRDRPDVLLKWLPIIWAQAYTLGGALEGEVADTRYGISIKNRSISSREETWDDVDFDAPTYTARLTREFGALNLGVSGHIGPFLQDVVREGLPPGKQYDDFDQRAAGIDARWKAGEDWTLWSEVIWSDFDMPNIGTVATWTWFIEAQYDWSDAWFTALRWNQQFFEKLAIPEHGDMRWDADYNRIDLALGHRLNAFTEIRTQYSYSHSNGDIQQGENVAGMNVVFQF